MRQLILISVGPVQDFIAAARRTRDLWFGSHILSELARAGARGLHESGAKLVMPALNPGDISDDVVHLQRWEEPFKGTGDEDAPLAARSVSNKLLAVLPAKDGAVDGDAAVKEARSEIRETWQWFADSVKRKCRDIIANRRDGKVWNEQVDSLLEFYAMWCDFPDGADYKATRKKLEAELAGRKNLREFDSWTYAGGWYSEEVENGRRREGLLPKSSLGGARLTVLTKDAHKKPTGKRLRIANDESLDSVGLIKRAGGKPHQFIPLMNVAAADWVERAAEKAPSGLQAARSSLDQLYESLGFERIQHRGLDWVKSFPFDIQLLREERWQGIFEDELGWKSLIEGYDWMKRAGQDIRPLLQSMGGPPTPYVACLVADGDRMGAATDRLEDWTSHFRFSRKLSNFSDSVREIVERDHRGILVYAGGDDVVAFVCLRDALDCARALAESFTEEMKDAAPPDADGSRPSLSVGVGIGHTLDSMAHLLDLGRRAETFAKAKHLEEEGLDRNALGVVLDKRSGGIERWRARWSNWRNNGGPVGRLHSDVSILQLDGLPSTKIYEVRDTLARFPHPDEIGSADNGNEFAFALRSDVLRTLERSGLGSSAPDALPPVEALGLGLDEEAKYSTVHRRIKRWTSRLIIARNLYQASDWSELRDLPPADALSHESSIPERGGKP